jgi:nitrate reductase gamma subunit
VERLHIFWIIHLIMLTLFGFEVALVLSIWLRGRVPGSPDADSPWRKLWAGFIYLCKLVVGRRFWRMLLALVNDGLVHRQLLRVSRYRWLAHITVFGSFVLLGVLSTVTGLAVEIFPNLLPEEHFLNTNVISVTLRNVDHPAIAFVNDFFGLVILFGMVLIIYRRYFRKDSQLRTIPADGFIIALLSGMILTGFLLEALRLLAHQPFALTAPWGFVGYHIALLLQPLGLDWEFWYNAGFWVHFVIPNILLFYAPFSRFAHIIMSPVIVTLNSLEELPA